MSFIMTPYTEEMAKHVWETFTWDAPGPPPLPLPQDCDDWCPVFDAQEAEEMARELGRPELAQATFYAMVLGAAYQQGIIRESRVERYWAMLKIRRWAFFEAFMWANREAIRGEGPAPPSPLPWGWTEEAAHRALHKCRWPNLRTSGTPKPLPGDHAILCPPFEPAKAEHWAARVGLPELVQATFFLMMTERCFRLMIISAEAESGLFRAVFNLRWGQLESWLEEHREQVIAGGPQDLNGRETRLISADAPPGSEDEETRSDSWPPSEKEVEDEEEEEEDEEEDEGEDE